jgi:hypothetical protein
VEKAFAAKDNQLLCTECYSHEYSSKCTTCKKTIMPGMEREGGEMHGDHGDNGGDEDEQDKDGTRIIGKCVVVGDDDDMYDDAENDGDDEEKTRMRKMRMRMKIIMRLRRRWR